MAVAAHVSAWIYGEVQGDGPFVTGQITRTIDYSARQAGLKSLPTTGTVFHPLSPAVSIGGVSCQSVIEVLPTGLQTHGRKYACVSDVSTLATAAG